MFGRKTEQAVSNWPKDKVNTSKRTVEITGQHTYPEHLALVFLILFVPAFFAILQFGWIGFAGSVVMWVGLYLLMLRSLRIRIDEATIRIKGKRYLRSMAPEFRVARHRKAHLPNTYFTNALEVVMQYGERRVSVAAMVEEDREKAEALALRLQTWTSEFEKLMDLQQAQTIQQPTTQSASSDFGPSTDVR